MNTRQVNIWQELGIEATREVRDIKRAYAGRLKQVHPEDDPEGFQKLRQAYEIALKVAAAPQPSPSMPAQQATGSIAQPLPPPPDGTQAGEPSPATPQQLAPVSPLPPPATPPVAPPVPPPVPRSAEQVQHMGRPGPAHSTDPRRVAFSINPAPPPDPAAKELLDRLLQAPVQERIGVLKAQLRVETWQGLDFQAALERCLLRQLVAPQATYAELIGTLSQYYDWKKVSERVGRADPMLMQVLARLSALEWRRSIETATAPEWQARHRAFLLLAKPPDEPEFKRFAQWTVNLKEMKTLLAELHAKRPEVLQFETDRASVKWWLAFGNTSPLTIDRILALLLFGVLSCTFFVGFINLLLQSIFGFDSWHNSLTIAAEVVVCIPSFLLIDRLRARWRRRFGEGTKARIQAKLASLRSEAKLRRIALATAVFSTALSLFTGFNPWFGIAALPALLALAFWYRTSPALMVALLYSWPLQAPFSLAVKLVFELPSLRKYSDFAPLLVFPHLLAAYAYWPFMRFCLLIKGTESRDPFRFTFKCSVVVALAGFIAAAIVAPNLAPPPSSTQMSYRRPPAPDSLLQTPKLNFQPPPSPPIQLQPSPPSSQPRPLSNVSPDLAFPKARAPAASPLLPQTLELAPHKALPPIQLQTMPPPRVQRPVAEANEVYKAQQARFTAIFKSAVQAGTAKPDVRPAFEYMVSAQGKVIEAHALPSANRNTALEEQLIAEIKLLAFANNDGFLPTSFTVSFGPSSPPPAGDAAKP